MARARKEIALAGVVAAILATGAAAQTQQVYRYVDKEGRVIYSDRVPPADAKDVQAKRMRGNVIESNEAPLAVQQAQERFPVTLYTFACGEVCSAAEGLLNRRGVPFSTVNVETQQGAEQLSKTTGDLRAPVLQVGDRTFVKGYSESQWNAALDDAGYPKAQPQRRAAIGKPAAPAATTGEPTVAPAAATELKTVAAPAQYPKQ
jgi:glutaredoxin